MLMLMLIVKGNPFHRGVIWIFQNLYMRELHYCGAFVAIKYDLKPIP